MNELKCKICGFMGMSLVSHITRKHKIPIIEYKGKYNEAITHLCDEKQKEKISNTLKKYNENPNVKRRNSEIQKNGASCLTKKYWINKGCTEEDAKKKVSELQKHNCKKHLEKNNLREGSHFCNEYWVARGYTKEDAEKKVSELQIKLSAKSSKFLGCVRTDDQKERISLSLKKMIGGIGRGVWAKHFGEFNGRSKSEIDFYNFIKENIDNSILANIPVRDYIVDIVKDKKIIEFYGDFWHANPQIFNKDKILKDHLGGVRVVNDIWKRDEKRIKFLKDVGYEVLVIWESDWNKNKEECIEKIRKYMV